MYWKSFVRALAITSLGLVTMSSGTQAFASGPATAPWDCNGQTIENYPTAAAHALASAATIVKPQITDPAGNNVTSDPTTGGQAGLAKKVAKIRAAGGCLPHGAQAVGKGTTTPLAKSSTVVQPMASVNGPGYAYLGNLVQQPQITNSWCGEATVTEMALTVPGPSYTNQTAVASYWGAGTGSGTSTSQLTAGLNHFVGVPDYGYNFYSFTSWLNSPNPSQFERDLFLEYLQLNIGQTSPVAGDAYEVPGGSHLAGHPVSKTILHWFEIGGWNTNNSTIRYADSVYNAPTVSWYASVTTPLTWYDLNTVETIMGGRGYVA